MPVRCFGTATGGFRVDTVIGGSGTYAYHVNAGTTPAFLQTDTTYTGFAAGNNTLFITDAVSGCTFDTTFVLAAPVRLAAAVNVLQQPTCGNADGSIRIVTATGGTAPYQFTLINGGFIAGPSPFGDSLRSGLAEGLYTLRIQDTLSCRDSSIFTLASAPQVLAVSVTPGNLRICPGQTVVFHSTLNVALPGALYQWYVNRAPIAGASADTLSISTLSPGDSVWVQVRTTSAPACVSGLPAVSNTVLVDVVSGQVAAQVHLTPGSVLTCPGTPVRLTAQNLAHITGVTYSFYVNDTLRQSGTDSTLTLVSPRDQTRIFAVLTAPASASCITPGLDTSQTVTVQVQSTIAATASVSASDTAACQGSAIVLRVASNLSSLPGFRVQWLRNGIPVSGATGATYAAIDGPGTYVYRAIVSLSNAPACVTGLPDTSARLSIRFRPITDPRCRPCQLRLTTDTVIGAACAAFFDGQIRLAGSGGSGRYLYARLVADTAQAYQRSPLFANLAVGNYGFVVRDSANLACTDTLRAVVVPARTNLSATVIVIRLSACSNTANGKIEIRTVQGGFGPYRYKVRTADTLSSQNLYTGLAGGNYPVTVHDDSTGCEYFTIVRVDTAPPMRAYGHVAGPVRCYGGADGVIIIDSVQNGTGGYAYSVTQPDTGYLPFVPGITLLQGQAAGTHIIYVRDAARCVATLTVTIRQPDSLRLAIGNLTRSGCSSATGTVHLADFGGGTGPRIYTLLRPGAARADTVPFPFADSTLRGLVGGDYILTIRDSVGCARTAAFRIPSDAPTVSRIEVIGNCPGSANGQIRLVGLSGGQRPYSFALTRADGFNRVQSDSLFGQLTAGIYTVTVTDSSLPACVSTYTRTLDVLDTLKATVLSFVPSTCSAPDGEAYIKITGGYPGYSYAYDSVAGSFTQFHTLAGDTLHLTGLTARVAGDLQQIKIMDSSPGGGCLGSLSFQMPGNTPVTYTLSSLDPLCFGDKTGRLVLSNVKGTGPLQVSAFDARSGALVKTDSLRDPYFNGSNLTLIGLGAGDYNVQVMQYGPCHAARTETVSITQPPNITPHYRNPLSSSPDFGRGEIELDSITGGVRPYRIRIGDNGTWQAYTPGIFLDHLLPGDVNLYVTDSNNCQVLRELSVQLDSRLKLTNLFSPNNDGVNDTWIIENLPAGSKVSVRSRWGREVFSASPYANDWTGDDLPDGVYLYVITPPTGDPIKGWVEILRAEGR